MKNSVKTFCLIQLICLAGLVQAHDIPSRVTVNAFVKPEGKELTALIRVPMEALGEVSFPLRGPGCLQFSEAQFALDDAHPIRNRITHDFRDPQLIDLTFEVALADLKRRILGVEEAADLEGDIAPLHPSGPRHGPFPEELSVEKQKVRLIGIPELPGDVVPVPIRDCKLLNGGALTKVWERGAAGEQPS